MLCDINQLRRHAALRNLNIHHLGAWLLTIVCLVLFINNKQNGVNISCQLKKPTTNNHAKFNIANYLDESNTLLSLIGIVSKRDEKLVRRILNSHPQIKCGREVEVVSNLLAMRSQWLNFNIDHERLKQAGISDYLFDSAVGAFILEINKQNRPRAKYVCDYEVYTDNNVNDETIPSSLFDSTIIMMRNTSKHILIVRDPRAIVHSIPRKRQINGENVFSYENLLTRWNDRMEKMHAICLDIGPTNCLPVCFEQLVNSTDKTLLVIHKFLGLKTVGGSTFKQTDFNVELDGWFNKIPHDILNKMDSLAPMLRQFYDPMDNHPNYSIFTPKNFQDVLPGERNF